MRKPFLSTVSFEHDSFIKLLRLMRCIFEKEDDLQFSDLNVGIVSCLITHWLHILVWPGDLHCFFRSWTIFNFKMQSTDFRCVSPKQCVYVWTGLLISWGMHYKYGHFASCLVCNSAGKQKTQHCFYPLHLQWSYFPRASYYNSMVIFH